MGEEYRQQKKHHWKIFVFCAFALILLGLWYTSTHPGFALTGNMINSFKSGNSTVRFYADLTVPSLQLNGNFAELDFKGNSDSYFYVAGERIKMNSMSNYIVLENYKGKLSFDSEKISLLKGTASRVLVNGLPVESSSSGNIQVSLDKDFQYSILNIQNSTKIGKIDYVSSGIARINDGENTFNINSNEVVITDFTGSIVVQNGKFRPDGYIRQFDIKGNANISVS